MTAADPRPTALDDAAAARVGVRVPTVRPACGYCPGCWDVVTVRGSYNNMLGFLAVRSTFVGGTGVSSAWEAASSAPGRPTGELLNRSATVRAAAFGAILAVAAPAPPVEAAAHVPVLTHDRGATRSLQPLTDALSAANAQFWSIPAAARETRRPPVVKRPRLRLNHLQPTRTHRTARTNTRRVCPGRTARVHTAGTTRRHAAIPRRVAWVSPRHPRGVAAVIAYARAQIGKRYVFGSAGPNTFDCSGLLVAAWARVGVHLPHQTGALIRRGRQVPRSQLRPGDVVFPEAGHVGLYIGGGLMIHAPHTGTVVKIAPLWAFFTARRI